MVLANICLCTHCSWLVCLPRTIPFGSQSRLSHAQLALLLQSMFNVSAVLLPSTQQQPKMPPQHDDLRQLMDDRHCCRLLMPIPLAAAVFRVQD